MNNDNPEILIPLDLCMRLIGLEEKPRQPWHQILFQRTITRLVHEQGPFKVKMAMARLLEDWRQLQNLL